MTAGAGSTDLDLGFLWLRVGPADCSCGMHTSRQRTRAQRACYYTSLGPHAMRGPTHRVGDRAATLGRWPAPPTTRISSGRMLPRAAVDSRRHGADAADVSTSRLTSSTGEDGSAPSRERSPSSIGNADGSFHCLNGIGCECADRQRVPVMVCAIVLLGVVASCSLCGPLGLIPGPMHVLPYAQYQARHLDDGRPVLVAQRPRGV